VTRGLFVLRYVSSSASPNGHGAQHNAAPTIRVTAQNATDLELLAWPDAPRNELRGPGDGLVIRALHDTTIVFEVMPSYAGGSVDAELHLEPVSRLAHGGFHRIETIAPRGGLEPSQPGPATIEVLAHVARRGDVVTPSDTWICGPDYPMAIEGVEIRWPRRPAGLDIVTTVSVSKNGIRNLPAVMTGEFAGTRGRAAPITSLEMALTGEPARDFALRADALFLGSSVQSRSGQSISLIGPTGREPLVGLRLAVVETRQASRPVAAPPARPAANLGSGARIRVFRGLKKGEPTGAPRGSAIRERERV
jgi:hypothetical protein